MDAMLEPTSVKTKTSERPTAAPEPASATEPTPVDFDVGAKASSLPLATDRKGRAPATWVNKKPSQYTFREFVVSLDICPKEVYLEKPADFQRGPPPVHPMWKENAFIVSYAMMPIVAQYATMKLFPGFTWNPWAAYFVFLFHFISFAYINVERLHYYMGHYGVFDEKVRGRDSISDARKDKLAGAILMYMFIRTAAPFLMAYDRHVLPTFKWYAPFQVGAWMIAIDFWFYIYHRSCHEVPWLWSVHRAHHGTKHPTPVLSILADDYQEVIEVIIVPLLASCVVPLPFHLSYIALTYLLYVEMLGHSGIRAYWCHPILSPILKYLDMDLSIEDHDLHHRYGRGGRNYGKQTRIFDKMMGTTCERIETNGIGGYPWQKKEVAEQK